MIITHAKVLEMKPCTNRYENFKRHYPNFNGNVVEFLSLDEITYSDKIWVMTRLLSRNQLVYWSIACAESVVHIYNDKHPGSKVLTDLFEYLKSGLDFDNLTSEQHEKIIVLRRAAAAADAADADAADAAADADAADAADAREEQKDLNLLLLASLTQEEI